MKDPTREIASNDSDTSHLLDSLVSLSNRCIELAKDLLAQVVGPLKRGNIPDISVTDKCRVLAEEYAATVTTATNLGIPVGKSLSDTIVVLQNWLTSTHWECFRSTALRLLDEIVQLKHSSGLLPDYLIEARAQAAKTMKELEAIHTGFDLASWESRLKPFQSLWRLLTASEALSELEAETALTQVADTFGRLMMSAVATRKLVVSSNQSIVSEPAIEHPRQGSLLIQNDDAGVLSEQQPVAPIKFQNGGDLAFTPVKPESTRMKSADAPQEHSALTDLTSHLVLVPTSAEKVEGNNDTVPSDTPPHIKPTLATASSSALSGHSRRLPDLPAGVNGPTVHTAVWDLLNADRAGLASHIATCWAELGHGNPVEPPALFRAAALAPFVRSSFGEIFDEFRGCVPELGKIAGLSSAADESETIRRLALFGLSLQPALLAPATGATTILQTVNMLDTMYPAIGRVRKAVAAFGEANIELSPSVLKGVQDHAEWAARLQQIRNEAREWLQANQACSLIYAATTAVWRTWLQNDGPLGRPLRLVIDDQRGEQEQVRQAAGYWSDIDRVVDQLKKTDFEIRKNAARQRPIEARAPRHVFERTQKFVSLVSDWLTHLASEPRTLDDYRQRRADEVRREVSSAIPSAFAEIDRAAGSGTSLLAHAAGFVRRALRDLQQLFDPAHEEKASTPPVRVLLGEELLALPDLDMTDEWQPRGVADVDRLLQLLDLRNSPYDPEKAFRTQTERQNHARTGQVIEALISRDQQQLAGSLQDQRDEHLRFCRHMFQQMLATTRAEIEQAVCYDLIDRERREQYSGTVEHYCAVLEDLLDFARARSDLKRIDNELVGLRASRVEQVQQKLEALRRDGLPANRHADIQVICNTLDRGDFLSAEEYLELVRSGQPLTNAANAERQVFHDFFVGIDGRAGFTRRFDDFMNGNPRPNPLDLIDCIRKAESVGPIDMNGVPPPAGKRSSQYGRGVAATKERKGPFRDP